MDNYLILDLETGSQEKYKRIGNPWYNPIVAIGLKEASGDFGNGLGTLNLDILHWVYTHKKVHVLVGHNIKFDLLYLWKDLHFQDWIKQGGKIWDTQYAQYLVSGNQDKYTALRDIAVRLYGCPEREKKMGKYWEQGIDTQDIPKELVLEDVQNDVIDTEQVYLQQLKLAETQGQLRMIEDLMDGLLATTEIEWNGMQIDLDKLNTNQVLLQKELDQKREELQVLTAKYWKIDENSNI